MGNRFSSGKNSIAECDRCGFRFKLTSLRKETVKTKIRNIMVCSSCWDPDQPQLLLGMYPVDDPQAVRVFWAVGGRLPGRRQQEHSVGLEPCGRLQSF